MHRPDPIPGRRRGSVYLVALALLTVFTSMALAFASFTDMNLRQGDNYGCATDARFAAESGLSYMLKVFNDIRLPGDTNPGNFADRLRQVLGAKMDGMPNLAGQPVSLCGQSVFVPDIGLDGGTFCCWITAISDTRCRMEVQGAARGASRRIAIELALTPRQPLVFDYGLASKGQVSISGGARILGVNYPEEASVLSATATSTEAIHVDGSVTIGGGLSTTAQGAQVVISGNPSIAGSTDPAVYMSHIHLGVDDTDFPELNTGPLQSLATNTVNSSTDISSQTVFNNIRIAANTNPTFNNNIQINGVVYVEAPNVVRFEGGAELNGFLVTQDAGQPIESCQVLFAGHVEAHGVEALPDTPQFAAVKQQTGTFIVAPGFGVTFAGSFSAINGSIAADQLTFTGTAEGVVNGSVIGLEDMPTVIGGNVDIYVDRENADPDPAGFIKSLAFSPVPDSYAEAN